MQPFTPPALEAAFLANSPRKIKYALSLEDFHALRIQEFGPEEFGHAFQFEWTDGVLVPPAIRDAIYSTKKYPRTNITYLEERMYNPLEDFVVCFVSSEAGCGVFLDPRASAPIPAGAILGVYAGELRQNFENDPDRRVTKIEHLLEPYRVEFNTQVMSLSAPEHKATAVRDFYPEFQIDAAKFGNITRFCLDMPDFTELESCTIAKPYKPSFKANIMVANLILFAGVYCGCPVTFIAAFRPINPGDPVGFSFENGKSKQTRLVYDRQGAVIGKFDPERNTRIILQPGLTLNKTKHMIPIPTEEEKRVARELNDVPNRPTESFDYETTFVANVNFALNVFMRRFAPNSVERIFLERTHHQFNPEGKVTTEQRYLVLRERWNELFSLEGLKVFKDEIIGYMATYKKNAEANAAAANVSSAPAALYGKKSGQQAAAGASASSSAGPAFDLPQNK